MSELQDDLDRYDNDHFVSKPRYVIRIVETARRVADLDYNAGRKAFQLSTGDADQAVMDAVDAALGITTEDTHAD